MSDTHEYLVDLYMKDEEDTIKTFAYNHFQVIDLMVSNEDVLEINLITNIDSKESWQLNPGSLNELRLLRNKIEHTDVLNALEQIDT